MMVWRVLVVVAVGVLAASGVSAQPANPRVFASAEPDRVFVGSGIAYVISFENLNDVDPPAIEVDWADVAYQGPRSISGTMSRNINGRVTREAVTQFQLRYTLTPREAGTFVIPAQTVRSGGRSYETNAVRVTVLEPDRATGGSVEVRLPRDEVWLGEVVQAEVVWTLPDLDGGSVRDFAFSGAAPEGFTVEPRSSQAVRNRNSVREVTLWGRRALGRVREVWSDGAQRTTLTVEVNLIPERAGELSVGPVDVVLDVSIPGSRSGPRRVLHAGEPSTLRVRALPDEGRPASFDGLIGRYAIEATASASVVNVGDPIDVLVTVRGEEPMRGVRTGPDLEMQPAWDAFRLSSDGWRFEPGGAFGERNFKTVVRAADDSIEAIPPIELAYFDPERGEYDVARSRPIPVEVRAVKQVTAADAVVAGGGAAAPTGGASVARSPLETTGGGVWANDLGAAVLASDSFVLAEAVRGPGFIAALVGPPAVWLVVTLARIVAARRDPVAARRKRALGAGLSMLRRSDSGGGVAAGVRRFVADRFDRSAASVTATDVRGIAEAIGSDAGRELAAVLARAEAAEVGGGPAVERSQVPDTRRLMRAFAADAAKGGA